MEKYFAALKHITLPNSPNKAISLQIDRWTERRGVFWSKFEKSAEFVDWHPNMPQKMRIGIIEYLIRHSMDFVKPAYDYDECLFTLKSPRGCSVVFHHRFRLHVGGRPTPAFLALPVAVVHGLKPAPGIPFSEKPPVSMSVRAQIADSKEKEQTWISQADELAADIDVWANKAMSVRHYHHLLMDTKSFKVNSADLPFCAWRELDAEAIAAESCSMLWFKAVVSHMPHLVPAACKDIARKPEPERDPEAPHGVRWDVDWPKL